MKKYKIENSEVRYEYIKRYSKLINFAHKRIKPQYQVNMHHCYPRCLNVKDVRKKNMTVALTVKEHVTAHYYLFKAATSQTNKLNMRSAVIGLGCIFKSYQNMHRKTWKSSVGKELRSIVSEVEESCGILQ